MVAGKDIKALQDRIDNRLAKISDKAVLVGISFFCSMSFLWLHAGRVAYTSFDIWVIYIGTMCIMIIPLIAYYIKVKKT